MKKITLLFFLMLGITTIYGSENEALFLDDSFTVDYESTETDYNVGANDGGIAGVFSLIGTASVNGGVISSSAAGLVTYSAPADYYGSDSFQYQYDDGGSVSTFTVNVTVNCNAPLYNTISASSVQTGTDVVYTISAPAGVTVAYSGDASGTAVNGGTVTVPQAVLTSGTATITIDSAYLTADNTCTTTIGNDYDQAYCNAPVAGDISASSVQTGTDVVYTISAPAGVTVSYSGSLAGTAVNGDIVTISHHALTSGTDILFLNIAYLTADTTCTTTIGNSYNQDYCNAPVAGDIAAISEQIGTDVVYTISAPSGVTVAYSGDVSGTAVNGGTVTVSQAVLTSGTATITLDNAYLTADNTCTTVVGDDYDQAYCNAPVLSDVTAVASVVGDDVVFTIVSASNVTSVVTSINGTINAENGDTITFVDGNLIHSIDLSVTISEAYLTSDNSCGTDFVPDNEIVFTVPRSRHPLAIDDVHTLAQTKSRTLKPLTRGTNDSDPNDLVLSIKTINGTTVIGGAQIIAVPDGEVIIDDENLMMFKSDNSFTGLIQFPYEIINTDGYEDDGVVFVTVDPLPNQPTAPTAIDDSYTMGQGTTLEVKPLSKGIDDHDPNDLQLFVTAIDGTTITGLGQVIAVIDGEVEVLNEEATEFGFTSNSNFTGTTSFDYTLTNLVDDIDTGTVTVEVEPFSEIPADPIATDDAYNMSQGTSFEIKPLTKGEDDSDPNDLNISIVSINGESLSGGIQTILVDGIHQVNIDVNGDITITPDPSFTDDIIIFPYTITNTLGLTATGNESVTVTSVAVVASSPTATNDNYSMDQGETQVIRPLTKGVNDSDPDNLDLTIFSIAGEQIDYNALPQTISVLIGLTEVGTIIVDTDEIIFTPSATTSGTITIPYVIKNTNDDSGSGFQIIEVIPYEFSGGPTATDDNYTMDQGDSLTLRPLTKGVNDSDPNGLDLTVFSIAGEEIDYNSLPATIDIIEGLDIIATVTVSSNSVLFTPAASTTGTVTFSYVIKNTLEESATGLEIIEVTAVDSGSGSGSGSGDSNNPVVVDDMYSMNQGTSRLIAPLTRHYDDSDPNDLELTITFIGGEEVNGGAEEISITNATISIDENDVMTFTPDSNYSGTLVIPYTIANTNGDTDSGFVNIIVDAVNVSSSAPQAIDDFYTTPQNISQRISPLTYAESDLDPKGETLSLSYINGEEVYGNNQIIEVPNGKLQVNSEDDITFIPNRDYLGFAMFSYEISNASGISDTGIQTIEIVPTSALNTDNFLLLDSDFIVYPNPSQGAVQIRLKSNFSTNARITLSDITGKTIYSSRAELQQGENNLDYNFNVSAGVLFLRITSNNQSVVKKLIFK